MKKFLGILLISSGLIVIISEFGFEFSSEYSNRDRDISYYNNMIRAITDGLFVIGMPLFFFSIIMITNAVEAFVAVGYTFKKMYRRIRGYGALPSYYDYKTERLPADTTSFGIAGLLVSIIHLAIAFYLSSLIQNGQA